MFMDFSWIFMDFHRFSWIFHGFSWIFMDFHDHPLWNRWFSPHPFSMEKTPGMILDSSPSICRGRARAEPPTGVIRQDLERGKVWTRSNSWEFSQGGTPQKKTPWNGHLSLIKGLFLWLLVISVVISWLVLWLFLWLSMGLSFHKRGDLLTWNW